MKSFLTLSLCVVAFFSNAQSFKKQKKQLLTEYNQSVRGYDSLFREYEHVYAGFPQQRKVFSTLLHNLEGKEEQLDQVKTDVIAKLMLLNNLGKLPDGISKTTFDTITVRIVNRMVGTLRQDIARVAPVSHSEFTLQFDDLDRKAQLEYLRNTIADVNAECRKLELEYQSLHSAIQRIEPVVQKLVAARELIALKTSALQANLDILNFELDQERENFRETGPKGFKEAYFITFPEVFPGYLAGELPTEKLAQDIHKKEVADMETVYQFVEEPAEFPGGNVALNKFLTDNLRYPQAALEEEIEGRCYLQFIVDRTGMISNVEVRRGVLDCPECDKEAIRLVEAMPKWKPGKNNGKPVNSRFNLPVTFKLN